MGLDQEPANSITWKYQPHGLGFRVKMDTPTVVKKSHQDGFYGRRVLHGRPEGPFCGDVKVKPGIHWRHQGAGNGKPWNTCQEELQTKWETSPGQRNVF